MSVKLSDFIKARLLSGAKVPAFVEEDGKLLARFDALRLHVGANGRVTHVTFLCRSDELWSLQIDGVLMPNAFLDIELGGAEGRLPVSIG